MALRGGERPSSRCTHVATLRELVSTSAGLRFQPGSLSTCVSSRRSAGGPSAQPLLEYGRVFPSASCLKGVFTGHRLLKSMFFLLTLQTCHSYVCYQICNYKLCRRRHSHETCGVSRALSALSQPLPASRHVTSITSRHASRVS